MKRLLQMEETI